MTRTLRLIVLLLMVGVMSTHVASAQKKKKGKKDETTQEAPKKKGKFDELTKDAEKIEGYFTFYKKDGKLYMSIPEDRLNQDFLITYELAKGIGARGLFGGTMLNIFEGSIVALEKHDGKIFLVKKPHRYTANADQPENAAVELTFGSSVLETAKIATTEDDTETLIDVYSWFVSDLSQISNRVKFAVSTRPGQPGRASFDKSRSYLDEVKSFPENSNIRANLTFKNSERFGPRTVADGRYIPVSIHYTLAALPEVPMEPREADDRVGFFMTVHKDFSDDDKTFFKRYVNKWRLECDGAAGSDGLCEVKEPIIYYIDHTVPVKYRQGMIDAVNAWGKAFEAAGFKNAIRGEMLPEGADPADIRYATLRWNVSDQSGYGAIGPSVVDPRTGEILDADILFEANMLLGFKNSWRNYLSPATAFSSAFEASEEELNGLQYGGEFSDFANEIAAQGDLVKTLMVAKEDLDPNSPVPDEVVNEFLIWVTMHEVGHTLGLRHNFRSSYDTPIDKLHDKSFTSENGVFSSVMEYPSPNIAPRGEENGHYYSVNAGSYDRWAISYGYTPSNEKAKEIAREAAKPGHAYGTDEDARGGGAIDPTVNVYDLGKDPLAWGKQRADLVKDLYDELPQFVLADNVPYYEVTNAFNSLLFNYARALSTGVKYIGGQYQYREHKGDPNERGPFVPVPKAKQQDALNFLIDYGFNDKAFTVPQDVMQLFGANRWSHWGSNTTFRGRIDYPYYEQVLGLQRGILNQLTHPMRFAKIRDAELKYGANNVVGIPEVVDRLTRAIWSEVWSTNRNISTSRRDLQRAYIDRMTEIITDAPNRTPADARAIARMKLSELRGRIGTNYNGLDAYTRAHLTESRARIDRALQAGLELKN